MVQEESCAWVSSDQKEHALATLHVMNQNHKCRADEKIPICDEPQGAQNTSAMR